MLQTLKSQIDSSMKSVQRLLQRPIKLDDGNLKLGIAVEKLRQQEREAKRQRIRQMRRELYELLGQHPSSRKLMRHLAIVERSLQESGIDGFEALPLQVHAKALAQLEGLVRDWSPTGLAELRSRLAVLVKAGVRRAEAAKAVKAAAQSAAPAAAANVDDEIDVRPSGGLAAQLAADVTEVDHAEFEEMERSWVGFVPQQAAPRGAPASA